MERTVLYAYYHLFRCIAKCRAEQEETPAQPVEEEKTDTPDEVEKTDEV